MRNITADLAIIGAGSAGLSTAAGCSMLGLNVVLFEKGEMGGDCLNYGCVPSKALISAAKAAYAHKDASHFGVTLPKPEVDWDAVKAHVHGAIATIAPVDSQERFEGLGVTVIREAAKFESPKTLISETTRVTARRIVIATGSHAFIPPIEGLDKVPYLTNEDIFHMPELPKHLIVLGAGPIGMELSQAFNRLGSEVTIVEMGQPLGRSEPDHAAVVVETLQDEGVNILAGHKAVRISGSAGNIEVHASSEEGEKVISGTHLLVAVGRRAILDGLDLEAGNVDHDRGGVSVGQTLRSKSNPRVWALGDSANMGQFTHIAGWHSSVFVRRALFKQRTKADSLPHPAVTYTSPELAQIGLSAAEAKDKFGEKVSITSFPFHENDRAISEGKTKGEAKLFIAGGKVVGASIVGEGAGDIIQMVGLAMSNGLKAQALTNFISPYPTRAEVVKRAASAHFSELLFSGKTKKLVGLLQRIP